MQARDATLTEIPSAQKGFSQGLQRNLSSAFGLLLLLVVILAAASLATWSIEDPSITYANGGKVRNALGFWGASFADLSMQFFGLAGPVALIPAAVWGWLKFIGNPIGRLRKRSAAWAGGLVFASAAIACMTPSATWPLPLGLGGVVGDAVLNIPSAFIGGYPTGMTAIALGILFSMPAIWLYAFAVSILGRDIPQQLQSADNDEFDYDEETEPSLARRIFSPLILPLGLIIHWLFVVKSFWGRMFSRTQTSSREMTGLVGDKGSFEPRFRDDTNSEYDEDDPASDWAEVPPVSLGPGMETPIAEAATNTSSRVVTTKPKARVGKRASREAQKSLLSADEFALPELHFLSEPKNLIKDTTMSTDALEQNARLLEGVLEDFGVRGQIIKVHPGPVVTLYELEPAPGIKSSRVIGLADDIARSMSAIAARVAVIPGRNAIGIELPNARRETVYLRELLASRDFENTKAKLALCLGKTIGGEPVIADLAKMPHLLMAGTTGSGKSVAINTMILSILYKLGPDQCKMIMIDPKMLELSVYDGIPHLLTPVVTDPKKAVVALKWTVREMEERYKKMSKLGVRNIEGFNTRLDQARKKGEAITRTVQTGFDRDSGEAIYEHEELDLQPLPFIIVVIDEMADLMMVAGKDIEGTVQRLAQMARAAGIHVIMATQRPSVDVITGTIKANFPTRISFQVTSKIDSRTILGEMGAEQLLGMGDMLYMAGGGRITRVHGPFVDDHEVEDVVNHLKAQGIPQYLDAVTEDDEEDEDGGEGGSYEGNLGDSDDPYDKAVAIVLRDRKASTSYIQRRLSIGYNRAASIIERMEDEGLVSPANHAGKREILVPAEDETF